MAGYSGGPEGGLPGSGVDRDDEDDARSGGCWRIRRRRRAVLEGNPFHEEALRIARLAGVDFSLNVSLDDRRRLTGVFAGEIEAAHLAGCAFAAESASVETEPADIVVTTSAGYPLGPDVLSGGEGTGRRGWRR